MHNHTKLFSVAALLAVLALPVPALAQGFGNGWWQDIWSQIWNSGSTSGTFGGTVDGRVEVDINGRYDFGISDFWWEPDGNTSAAGANLNSASMDYNPAYWNTGGYNWNAAAVPNPQSGLNAPQSGLNASPYMQTRLQLDQYYDTQFQNLRDGYSNWYGQYQNYYGL